MESWCTFRSWIAGSLSCWPFVFILIQRAQTVIAQVSVNGQIFTQGLSIINSPAPNTPFRVGSTLPISIDVSGNGRLPASAVLPGSGLRTRYDALEIYLVSSQTAANITVSAGPELLSQETGSVRHLNWPIPSCVPAGLYNMTVYEASHINDQAYFSITAIPIALSNDALLQSPCSTGSNALQPQPQPCSPLMQSPFLPNQLKPLYTGRITSQTPSASGALPSVLLSTTTVIPPPSSVTVVLVSTTTVVTTENGLPVTTTLTTTATAAVATQPDSSGFFPVNSSHRSHIYLHRLLLSTMLGFFALVYV